MQATQEFSTQISLAQFIASALSVGHFKAIELIFIFFLPLDCESYADDNECNRDGPKQVTIVGVDNSWAASRFDVFPGDIRRKPNLVNDFEV